jgi:hypothetical protein
MCPGGTQEGQDRTPGPRLYPEGSYLLGGSLRADDHLPQRLFEKYQAASRLSIKRVIATYTNVSLVVGNSS